MARILPFPRGKRPDTLDTVKVWQYVLPRLGFPLPDFISDEIDKVIARMWSSADRKISYQACVDALGDLARRDIMIPLSRRERIVELVFEYLERSGYISGGE